MPSVFSRIIAGDIPCHRVASDAHWLAFLDIHPVAPGHTLLVPYVEVQFVSQLPAETLSALGGFLGRSIAAIKAVTAAPAVNVIINDGPEAGQEIAHAHIHLIPRHSNDGQRIGLRHVTGDHVELAELAQRIARAWSHQA